MCMGACARSRRALNRLARRATQNRGNGNPSRIVPKMLQKLSIGQKLFLIVAVFSTVLVGTTTFMLSDMRSGMLEDRRAKLRALVEAAVNTVNRYGDLA